MELIQVSWPLIKLSSRVHSNTSDKRHSVWYKQHKLLWYSYKPHVYSICYQFIIKSVFLFALIAIANIDWWDLPFAIRKYLKIENVYQKTFKRKKLLVSDDYQSQSTKSIKNLDGLSCCLISELNTSFTQQQLRNNLGRLSSALSPHFS